MREVRVLVHREHGVREVEFRRYLTRIELVDRRLLAPPREVVCNGTVYEVVWDGALGRGGKSLLDGSISSW